jgi:hypothetical protein
MVKSASSFATQIAVKILQSNSIDIISLKEFIPESNGLFLNLDQNICQVVRKALPILGAKALVIKSHADFPNQCKELIEANSIKIISTFRDPAEIALSLIDAGKKDEALGRVRFNAYKSVEDTLEAIDWQISCFYNWAKGTPNFLPLYYDDLTSDSITASNKIANFLGLSFEDSIIKGFLQKKDSIWEFNKGILGRAEKELDSKTYDTLKIRWSEFYRFIEINRNAY